MNGTIKVFAGRSHPKLAAAICAQDGIEKGEMTINSFGSGQLYVNIEENVRELDCFVIVSSSASPEDEHTCIMEALMIIDALKYASAGRITLVLPYMPYSRTDRRQNRRIAVTARLMCQFIEAAGADRVLVMDLHCSQGETFFRIPVDHLHAERLICDHLIERGGIENATAVAGDVGESKEIGGFAKRLEIPIAIIDKRRVEGEAEKVEVTELIGTVEEKHAVIFDDEVASGGTLIAGANFLLDKCGALSVEAVCTHPVLSGDAVANISASRIQRLTVMDTISTNGKEFDKLTVLREPTSIFLGKAIRRVHSGGSILRLNTGE